MTFTVGETLPGGGVVTSVTATTIGVRYEGVEFIFDRAQFEQGIAYVLELLKLGAA